MKSVINHLGFSSDKISKIVLLPGDPARAEYICREYLSEGQELGRVREFWSFRGLYRGVQVGVTSTGIGCPSTAIAVSELIDLGAKILIRVGTCGGALRKDIAAGSIIIPTATIREEGTTAEYVDPRFPAVADYRLVAALEQSAIKQGFRCYVGLNRTHDAFYGNPENLKRWATPYLRNPEVPCSLLSSEMEAAALFVIAQIRGVQAGAVLAVNAPPEDILDIARGIQPFAAPGIAEESEEAGLAVDRAIKTALDGACQLLQ